jgi:GT2 family glycosyltransferase
VSSFYRIYGLSRLFPRSSRFARYNLTYLDPDETIEVDSVVGSFMMVRREAIDQVGLLDESFFMYGDDLDWAYRMKAAGWKVYYNADVTVLHYKGEASKTSRKAHYEFYRAMHIFYEKHYRATTAPCLYWLVAGGIAIRGGLAMLLGPTAAGCATNCIEASARYCVGPQQGFTRPDQRKPGAATHCCPFCRGGQQ